jgi:hypothetical protein
MLARCAYDVACEHAPGLIEGDDVKTAAQDKRKLGFTLMAMGAEVGLPIRDHEEALNRIVRRGVDVVMRACSRTRRRLCGELIEECAGEKPHRWPQVP